MKQHVFLDTGPLIALIDHRDQWHSWAKAQFAQIVPPLMTCEAVLTEATFLAQRMDQGTRAVFRLFDRRAAILAFDLSKNFAEVSALMQRYAKLPMSLADASLVRMAELYSECVVLTLDSDFRIYRRYGRRNIPLLIPPGG